MSTPPRATLDRDGYLPTWALLTGGGQLLPMGDHWRWPGGGPMMAREPSERGEMHPTKPLMTNGKIVEVSCFMSFIQKPLNVSYIGIYKMNTC